MRHLLRPITLGLCLGILSLQLVHAGDRTYRWTDEKGRVHYSDVKNDKGEQVTVKPGSGAAGTPKTATGGTAGRVLECQQKKDQLNVYNSSLQITETDSLGNSRTYTAAERQKLIDSTQQQMQTLCSPAAGGSGQDAAQP